MGLINLRILLLKRYILSVEVPRFASVLPNTHYTEWILAFGERANYNLDLAGYHTNQDRVLQKVYKSLLWRFLVKGVVIYGGVQWS